MPLTEALDLQRVLGIAMADDGSFVITWRDNDNNIYAKGFDATAKQYDDSVTGYDADTNIIQVNATTQRAFHYRPAISMNESGDFYITYVECLQSCLQDDPHNCIIDHCQIMARGFDKNGHNKFAESAISDKDKIDESSAPTVCLDKEGNAVLGWKALTQSKYDKYTYTEKNEKDEEITKTAYFEYGDIHRKRISSKGITIGSIDTIHQNNVGDQTEPDVTYTASGKHVFVFTDDVDEDKNTEIYGKGFNRISNE